MCIQEFITDENVAEKLAGLMDYLVAPGFGHRGIEGKITAIKYARENRLAILWNLPWNANGSDRICQECVGHQACSFN